MAVGNNCILYLNGDEFYEFISSLDPLTELRNSQFNNSLVKLSNDEWKSITSPIYNNSDKYPIPDGKYGVILLINNVKFKYISATNKTNNYIINKNILYELNFWIILNYLWYNFQQKFIF